MLNPVRVKGNSQIGAWKWSSYRATAGLEAVPDFLTVNWILSQFGQKRAQAQKKYREFVAEGLDDRPWEKLRGQIFLATEEFIRRHRSREKDEISEVPRLQRRPVRVTLHQIFGKNSDGRAIDVAYREHGYRMNEIAQHLGVHYATVSRRLKAFENTRAIGG